MQNELRENGEETTKALSAHVVNMYANIVGNFVQLESVDALKKDIQQDPIIKDSMACLGVLVHCTFGTFLAPAMLLGHTLNHTRLSTSIKNSKELEKEH